MNKFAQVALSSLIAITSVTSVASPVKAQRYYNPQQPTGGYSTHQLNPNKPSPNQPIPSQPGNFNPQQFPQSNQTGLNPVGRWQCQIQEQGQGLVSQVDFILNVSPNQQFNAQGNGFVMSANGQSIPIQGRSQGSWNTNSSGVLFSGQSQMSFQGQSETSAFSHQYITVNPQTIMNQSNVNGTVSVTTCQKI